jgi:uncharacterized protein YwbE
MLKNGILKKDQKNGKLTKEEGKLKRYYDSFLGSF